MVIAIDGTSGSGKSSVARLVAEAASFELLNTGKIYRRIAAECLKKKIPWNNEVAVIACAKQLSFDSTPDIDLHSEEISRIVPFYARIPEVRTEVRKIQQAQGDAGNIVVEGRDIGSVVFPNADLKFFVTASLEERAKRRQRQLGTQGREDLEAIMKGLEERDHQDEHRAVSPLAVPPDAEMVDTTHMTLEQVVGLILDRMRKIS